VLQAFASLLVIAHRAGYDMTVAREIDVRRLALAPPAGVTPA
jgi:hypothetical protein